MRKLIYLMLVLIPVLLWQLSSTVAQSETVEDMLIQLGLDPDRGSLKFQSDRIMLDMSDLNNQYTSEAMSSYDENFVLHALIRQEAGDTLDQCGFLFRQVSLADSFYMLQISRDGTLMFSSRVNGEWEDDQILDKGDLILPDLNDINELILVAVADQFAVYINGQHAGEFQHAALEGGGSAVLGAAWGEEETTRCVFRDVWLVSLRGNGQVQTPSTPSPDLAVSDAARDGLALAGFTEDSGSIGVNLPEFTLDLSMIDTGVIFHPLDGQYANFVMGTTITWGPEDTEDLCGIQFRREGNENYYVLWLDRTGFLAYNAVVDNEWEPLIALDSSNAQLGADATNTLMLIGNGGVFRLYVNGWEAGEFAHTALAEGRVGLMGATLEVGDQAFCAFEDTWVWSLNPDVPLPIPPIPTPIPEVQLVLSRIGIAQSSGYEAERIDRMLVNLTDEDNLFRWELFDNSYTDFVLGTTFIWGPGHVEDECGVRLRTSDEGSYLVFISQDQNRMFLEVVENNRSRDVEYFDLPMLRGGEGEANNLWVAAVGDTFVFYLNGLYIGQYQNDVFESGEIGLMATTGSASDITYCTFEDSWVWELAYDTPAIMTATPDFPSVMTVIPTWTPEPM
jgi:hypothetical protein